MKVQFPWRTLFGLAVAVSMVAGCGGPQGEPSSTGSTETTGGSGESAQKLEGSIRIDGSSTVYKVTAQVAEAFMGEHEGVDVKVNISGTGGGFKKFGAGETDISNASRPIKGEEVEVAKSNGIDFIELPVGYDGITVVVNTENDWATSLTVAELKKIWEPNSTIKSWKDVRVGFPDVPIKLYGPGPDSGTFDFFTKVIVGKEKEMRTDFQASEDDNVIVTGVAGDKGAIGYFGLAYYEENSSKLKAVSIDAGKGPIVPSKDTVKALTYQPLSRPEFIYVSSKALDRPEVKAFLEYYLSSKGQDLVGKAGYVPFEAATYDRVMKIVSEKKMGSLFDGKTGEPVESVLESAGL